MKQKLIITLMILFIGGTIIFMVKDLFKPQVQETNPFVYDIEEFKSIDSTQLCYKEVIRFNPIIEGLKAIAIDENDNLFLVGKNKLIKYDSALALQSEFSIDGTANSMYVSSLGHVFLGMENHIEVYSSNGEKLGVWSPFNKRSFITSIAVKSDWVFVADAGNKIILKYNLQGELQQEIGARDSVNRRKGFVIPSPYFDVALGRQGEIWAVNSGLHQLEAYNEQGELFSSWNRTSMKWDGFSGCCNPSHIALLSDGSFVTSEKGLVRIKIHEPTGNFKCAVATPKEFEEGTRGIDLAVDSKDRIFAIVPEQNEVRVYEKK